MPHKKYLELIRKEFPDHKWKDFKYLTHGWDHNVIILDNEWVFRFPKNKEYLKKLQKEIELLKYLNKQITLPIPNYTLIAKDKSFAGYKIIKGKEFKPWIYKNKVALKNKKKIINQLVEFFNELHSIPLDKIKKYDVKFYDSKKETAKIFKDVKKYVFPKLNKRERQISEKYFKDCAALETKSVKNTFIHIDIHYSNVLIKHDDSELAGVIDFSDRVIGDPATDFAHLWNYGPKFIKSVYKKYRGPKDPEFLYRSKLYSKWDAFGIMIESFKPMYKCTFKEGHKMFRKLFF
ncbi:aminoglycoside phosphotransferase family protein [Patescibacteria group bacterium]|nr:aminoglycoside phosphotransferase family protein [Patescibacteria group bacterium]MBU1683404.1 aminoglycoside phosphotransferase family protein [Patescibacteria group bacterium]